MGIGGQERGTVASGGSAWAGGVDLEQLQDVCLQRWGLWDDRRVGAAGRQQLQPGQRGKDQPPGGPGGAVSPQPIQALGGGDGPADLPLHQAEHQQGQADDGDQGGDASVGLQEHGRDRQWAFEAGVAALDNLLTLVAPQDLGGVSLGGIQVGQQGVPAVGSGLGVQGLLVEVPRQGGLAGGGVGADLGTQDADQLAAGGDGAHAGGDRVGVGVVAAAQPALQPSQVVLGALQLAGAVGLGGLGAGRGPHQHPPHRQDRVAFGLARQGHGVLDDPVAASPLSRLALVTGRDVVDRGGSVGVEGGEGVSGHVGLGGRRDEADLGAPHRPQVGVGDQLGVADQQQPPPARQLLERGHRADDLGDL